MPARHRVPPLERSSRNAQRPARASRGSVLRRRPAAPSSLTLHAKAESCSRADKEAAARRVISQTPLGRRAQDSLGGRAKVCMFVHINPETDSSAESLSTLYFAQRAASVMFGQAKANAETVRVLETASPRRPSEGYCWCLCFWFHCGDLLVE